MGILRFSLYTTVTLAELAVSVVVHLGYGSWILGTAIMLDVLGMELTTAVRNRAIKAMPLMVSAFSPVDASVVEVESPRPVGAHQEKEASATGIVMDAEPKAPIVMVHGIFGFGKGKLGRLSYWAGAELKDDRVLVPDLGSLTSIHDRAIRLFYYLKGGTVDYGARAQKYGHSRFGQTYDQGNYPEWDEKHPIHVVGHSTGVQVARCLQQLLAEKAFPGHEDTSADWVLSITSLSGALNGTTRVHVEGISEEDGRSMRYLCLLQGLRLGVIIYEWLDISVLKRYYGFGFEHYDLSWRKIGLTGLISGLVGRSGPFTSTNWIIPDLSIHSALEFNSRVQTYPNTYYVSYATKITRKLFGLTLPSSLLGIHPLLLLRTFQICLFRFKKPPYQGFRAEEWKDNDGALNTKSQLYPCLPTPHPHRRIGSDGKVDGRNGLRSGIWYYSVMEADHISFIIDKDRAGIHFDILYDGIFQRIRKDMLQKAWSQARVMGKGAEDLQYSMRDTKQKQPVQSPQSG